MRKFVIQITLALLSTGAVQAEKIGSWDVEEPIGTISNVQLTSTTLNLGFWSLPDRYTFAYEYDFGPFTEDDVGKTIWVDSYVDPLFTNLVARLTDGENEGVRVAWEWGSKSKSESQSFGIPTNSLNGIDYYGLGIKALSFTLNSLTLDYASGDTEYGWSGTFSVHDTSAPIELQIFTATELEWNTVSGKTYQVQWQSDLSATNWNDLGDPVLATSGNYSFFDSTRDTSNRFYRIQLVE